MSIRHSILAILDQGACYGLQLRLEFEKRTGGSWPVNVGQVYSTLDRLERDGFATKSEADAGGHVYWRITAAGRDDVREWLARPIARPTAARDELAIKIALATTLPGTDAAALIAIQRRETAAALHAYQAEPPGSLTRQLVLASLVCGTEAQLRWLDQCDAICATAVPFAIDAEAPKRGRPRVSAAD